jgi:SAM-dependent methyltransferase
MSFIELNSTDLPALDIGCGKGTWLKLLCYYNEPLAGIGLDVNPTFLATARRIAQEELSNIRFIEQAASEYPLIPASHSAVLCVGSSHAYGGLRQTLQAAWTLLAPGGYLLLGEGYWKQPPNQTYLDFLGAEADSYGSHADNAALAEAQGFITLYSLTSSEDEWDEYEGLYKLGVERYAQHNPDDPDVPAMVERIRAWNRIYLQQGRATLGFGLYLLQKP